MPPGIGFSFQPGSQDTPLDQRGQGGQGTAPQQAIRTLSLRVPQTTSVPGIAPLPLLNAKGGGGTDLDMLLMALLKAFGPQGMTGGRQNVAPRVTPIDPPGRNDTEQMDLVEELRRRTGGNTGIGNTGRARGPLSPVPPSDIPPFVNPDMGGEPAPFPMAQTEASPDALQNPMFDRGFARFKAPLTPLF